MVTDDQPPSNVTSITKDGHLWPDLEGAWVLNQLNIDDAVNLPSLLNVRAMCS